MKRTKCAIQKAHSITKEKAKKNQVAAEAKNLAAANLVGGGWIYSELWPNRFALSCWSSTIFNMARVAKSLRHSLLPLFI